MRYTPRVNVHASLRYVLPGKPPRTVTIGSRPLTIGRAPSNELVVTDEVVSWHHALLWVEGDGVYLRDLGSRNGTWLNDERVTGDARVRAGDRVRLGTSLEMEVELVDGAAVAPRVWMLVDGATGLRHPIHGDRFSVGSDPRCALVVEGAPPLVATLLQPGNGEVWIGPHGDAGATLTVEQPGEPPAAVGPDAEDFELRPGARITVAGRTYELCEAAVESRPDTVEPAHHYPYRLEASLSGATGPEAVVIDVRSDRRHRVEADNRAVLLYLLARQYAEDRAAKRPRADRGWMSDEDVSSGIWGRSPTARDTNSLHVLVHRLRKELETGGFDPWFIEKRRRYIRVRVEDVQLR